MAGCFFWEDELCKTSNLEVLHSTPPEIWDNEVKMVDINPNVRNGRMFLSGDEAQT